MQVYVCDGTLTKDPNLSDKINLKTNQHFDVSWFTLQIEDNGEKIFMPSTVTGKKAQYVIKKFKQGSLGIFKGVIRQSKKFDEGIQKIRYFSFFQATSVKWLKDKKENEVLENNIDQLQTEELTEQLSKEIDYESLNLI